MFVFHHGTTTLILLLYINDIILTGSSIFVLHWFIFILSHQFAMKDLGDLHYFLGVQVVWNSKGIFLTQQKYDPLQIASYLQIPLSTGVW